MYEDVCHYEDQRFEIHRRVVARKDGSRKILLLTNGGERREINVRGTLAKRDLLDVFSDDVLGLLRHESCFDNRSDTKDEFLFDGTIQDGTS